MPINHKRQAMRLRDAVNVVEAWLRIGGRREVDVAALEPTLWHEDQLDICDLVVAIKQAAKSMNYSIRVNITTNGLLLSRFVARLKKVGLDKLRVSWHTTDPVTFANISGVDDYLALEKGILQAAALDLNVSFDRILLRNHLDDLPNHLDRISQMDTVLKLYDLYWTPKMSKIFHKYHVPLEDVIRQYVEPRSYRVDFKTAQYVRHRTVYHLVGGGRVETKTGSQRTRTNLVCDSCNVRTTCVEGFGDYLRIEPELDAFPCYLRRDLAVSLRGVVASLDSNRRLDAILERAFGISRTRCNETKLRLVVVPYCNLRCVLPGTDVQLCLKSNGNYTFAKKHG